MERVWRPASMPSLPFVPCPLLSVRIGHTHKNQAAARRPPVRGHAARQRVAERIPQNAGRRVSGRQPAGRACFDLSAIGLRLGISTGHTCNYGGQLDVLFEEPSLCSEPATEQRALSTEGRASVCAGRLDFGLGLHLPARAPCGCGTATGCPLSSAFCTGQGHGATALLCTSVSLA